MIRDYFQTHRLLIVIAVIAVVALAAVVLWFAADFVRPMPPRTLTMVTGPEGGAYENFGKRYQEILARDGIELRLLPTAGALENLAKLRDHGSGVDVGFLQSGITSAKESPDLVSLGTVFYEPLWFFASDKYARKGIQSLRGKKISIGPEGSGSRELALKLLKRNGIDQGFAELLSLTPQEAGERAIRGEIDAAILLSSWDAPVVQRLLAAHGIEPANFPRTDAYLALYPYLNKVVLPEGVIDLANNRPASDVFLIAPKANLVVRGELHPALQFLLLKAAEEIHSGPGMFQKPGQFPAAESIDLPLSDQARQFYRSGSPFLQQHLPFWLAVLIGRLLVLLIPLVGVLYPLLRLFPALYGWQIQRRIFRLYGELRFLEHDLETRGEGQNMEELLSRLDRIEEKAH
ncbi:MAG: TAXI family TRAP transporter solute-binding subunit, partial [Gallionella sp.]